MTCISAVAMAKAHVSTSLRNTCEVAFCFIWSSNIKHILLACHILYSEVAKCFRGSHTQSSVKKINNTAGRRLTVHNQCLPCRDYLPNGLGYLLSPVPWIPQVLSWTILSVKLGRRTVFNILKSFLVIIILITLYCLCTLCQACTIGTSRETTN